MMQAMEDVNGTPKPAKHRAAQMTWLKRIQRLVRLGKRNPKLFFRELRRGSDLAPLARSPPIPPGTLQTLQSVPDLHDPTVTHLLKATDTTFPDLQPCSKDTLRPLLRVPRAKSPGTDGVPPYLYYLLGTTTWTSW